MLLGAVVPASNPSIPASFGRLGQEDQMFNIRLGNLVSSRVSWTTQEDPEESEA